MSKPASVLLLILFLIVGTIVTFEGQPVKIKAERLEHLDKNSSELSLENVTVHEGDFIVNETQSVIIQNCTYIIKGNVYVEDWGELIVENAHLVVNPNYTFRNHEFCVRDHGVLGIQNGSVDSQFGVSFFISGQAQVDLLNVSFMFDVWIACFDQSNVNIDNSVFAEIENTDSSTVMICNSEITGTLGTEFLAPSQVVILDSVKPGLCKYWNLHQNLSTQNVLHNLTIEDSLINCWSVGVREEANVTIMNSEIHRIRCESFHSNFTFDGARLGFYENFTQNKLTLVNTSITGFWFFWIDNCLAELSNVEGTIALVGRSNASIINSTVHLSAWYLEKGFVHFQEVRIESIEAKLSNVYVSGEIDFLTGAYVYQWISANFTIAYDLIATNETGDPMADVQLKLYDENDTIIYSDQTDDFGRARLNLTYSDNNYTDIFTLEAVKDLLYCEKIVGILSDNPILTLLPKHDGNIYSIISSKTVVGQNFTLVVKVRVINEGGYIENFSLTVYANTSIIKEQSVLISSGASKLITFTWDTTSFTKGNYTIKALLDSVPGETDTSDNTFTGDTIYVGIPGDINADGTVDIFDAVILSGASGSTPGDEHWNPNADINSDLTVDIFDAVILSSHA